MDDGRSKLAQQIAEYEALLARAQSAQGDPICACVAHWCTGELARLRPLLRATGSSDARSVAGHDHADA